MVVSCCEAAFYKTLQKNAHHSFVTLQMLALKHVLWSFSVLKIRVSMVRFRPRTPNEKTPTRVSRWGFCFQGKLYRR